MYTAASPFARPEFRAAEEIGEKDVRHLVETIRTRVLRLFLARGLLTDEGALALDAEGEEGEEGELLPLFQAASIQGRVAQGPDAGRSLERLSLMPDGRVLYELRSNLHSFLASTTKPLVGASRASVQRGALACAGCDDKALGERAASEILVPHLVDGVRLCHLPNLRPMFYSGFSADVAAAHSVFPTRRAHDGADLIVGDFRIEDLTA